MGEALESLVRCCVLQQSNSTASAATALGVCMQDVVDVRRVEPACVLASLVLWQLQSIISSSSLQQLLCRSLQLGSVKDNGS